jgi:hypothetical protein
MSYEDIVEAQKKRDAKDASASGGTRRSGKRKGRPPVKGTANKRPRTTELEDAEEEIKASGLGEYCSGLQF